MLFKKATGYWEWMGPFFWGSEFSSGFAKYFIKEEVIPVVLKNMLLTLKKWVDTKFYLEFSPSLDVYRVVIILGDKLDLFVP